MSLLLKKERNLLLNSVIIAIIFAFAGVIVGFYAKSQTIIFDGLYSLISVLLSFISLSALNFMSKKDHKNYPYGKDAVEPLVIILKYSFILIFIIGSIISSTLIILNGGKIVNLDISLIYSSFSTILCLFMYILFKIKSKKINSGLLNAETSQWAFDTIASLSVLITFSAVFFMEKYNLFTFLVPYVDPTLVIILSLFFAKVPIAFIKSSLKEVLFMAPEKNISTDVENIIFKIEKKYMLKESFLRVSKIRKTLWVELDFVVDNNSKIYSIQDQDLIRKEISQKIDSLKHETWLTVSFTLDRKWAL